MAVLFESGNTLLWNPSPRIAQVFLAHVRAIESAEDIASGIGELIADEVSVDPSILSIFVTTIGGQLERTSNPTTSSLFAGAFAISCGLLSACGATLPLFEGEVGQLAHRGVRLVSGQGRPGPIFEGLGVKCK